MKTTILIMILAMTIGSCNPSARDAGCTRSASVAGRFYPADSARLKAEVDSMLASAGNGGGTGVQALIAPHAGYVFSGGTAAKAFASISPKATYRRVFLLGPSHKAAFDGASVDVAAGRYETPLGSVAVDREAGRALMQADSVFACLDEAHEGEHCLEVQLPFLQERLDTMPPIVPIIIGTQDIGRLRRIARALQPYFTAGNLFVISSDFSHYPAYDDACRADSITGKAIGEASLSAFIEAINDNAGSHIGNLYTSACGQSPIAVLLMLMESAGGLAVEHLGYCNSGDSPYGSRDEVVGYHAFAVVRRQESGRGAAATEPFALSRAEKATLLRIARRSIEDSLARRPRAEVPAAEITPALEARCGAFVTLNAGGRLRGCIGNLMARRPLYRTVEAMARAAAFEDPRFTPLGRDELGGVSIEISVLSPLRRVASAGEIVPGRHGIYMVKGARSGTFLPQVAAETGWTVEELLGHCARDKAGIGWDGWRDAELYVYEAEVFGEDEAGRQ